MKAVQLMLVNIIMQTYNDYIDEMLLALRANIEYLKTQGSSQIKVRNGKLINVLENGFVYSFDLEKVQDIDEEADVEVHIGRTNTNGKVTACTDSNVQILLEEHLGDHITEATLVISSFFLLEKLHEHLSNVKIGELSHSSLAEKTLKLAPSTISLDSSYLPKPGVLDSSQENAVRTALGSEVTYIWGPPGTGKSQTIASLVEELIDRDLSVLLIAHTNAATDSVLKKAVELLEEHPIYKDGRFLRLGSRKSIHPDLLDKKVIPEIIFEEKAKPIRDEIDLIKGDMLVLSDKLSSYAEIEKYNSEIDELKKAVRKADDYILARESALDRCKENIVDHNREIKTINESISTFQNKGSFSRLFSGTNLDKLTAQKSVALTERDKTKNKADALSGNIDEASRLRSEYKTQITSLLRHVRTMPNYLTADEVKNARKQLTHYKDQIDVLEEQLTNLGANLLIEAKVIATTLTKTYIHKPLLARNFDVVILDEASMAPLPAVASVAGLSSQKVVLVGDFFQLPPIANHRIDAKRKTDEEVALETMLVDKWLKQDVFSLVGIEDAVRRNLNPDPWLVQLNTQYRMHPDISALINELVYAKNKNFKLNNGANTTSNGKALLNTDPLKDAHLGFYDTATLGSLPTKSDSGSWYNLSQALVAVELAKQAIKSGYKKIGIISAYRAQINLINQIVSDELGEDKSYVEADTVHRFQGGAKQVIIFDVTTPFTNTMYDDGREGGDDEKLINVAFSRAEEKCIVLGDVKAILNKHSDESLIKRAIVYCQKNNLPTLSAKDLLTNYYTDDRTESWLEKLANSKDIVSEIENAKLFDQSDFYTYFMQDLIKTEQEVVIQSAFLTLNRLEKTFMPMFKALIARGVRVFVVTRVSWEHDGQMEAQSEKAQALMEKAGVTVLPFLGKIHQKFAFIDRKLMWDGSLNILSWRDTSETMRRYEGTKAVAQYMAFHRLDKNIGEIGENKLRHCDVCTLPGSWYWTKKVRGKMWTFCLTGNHSAGMAPKTSADRNARKQQLVENKSKAAEIRKRIVVDSSGKVKCPVHNRLLIEKTGRFGQYWECPLVKECACTISPSQLSKLKSQYRQTGIL